MKRNFKISQFEDFCKGPGVRSWSKYQKWLKLLNSFPFIKWTLPIIYTFEFDHFDWLSQPYSEWRETSKLVNLKISAKVLVCDFGQNLKMTNTSQFRFIHQENTCKSCLHSSLIILTFFHRFTVNEDKLQNFRLTLDPSMRSRSKFDND